MAKKSHKICCKTFISVKLKNSDFSPSFGNSDYNEIYFTSSREGGLSEDIDERTGENYTDIYVSKLQKTGKWSAPALITISN